MKIALLILTLLVVLMSFAWVNLPLLLLDLPDLAFGLSWLGMELMGLLVAVVVVFTLLVLISLGVIGFVLAFITGTSLLELEPELTPS